MPRPTICLNSVIEPTSRSSTISRQVCASTPVESSREVVTSTGIFRFRVDEVAELGLALGVAAGDAHDVAVVLGDQIGVLVDERLAHPRRVFLIDAEDDGLLEAVAALLEELGDLLGDQLGAVVEHQRAVEVLGVVDAVLDLLALAVELALLGPVALHVAVDVDLDHLVGREEAVADALLQRVGVDRLAEVVRCWRRTRFPSAWRSGRSAWPTRSIRGFRATPNPRPRCRGGTRRSRSGRRSRARTRGRASAAPPGR